MWTRAELKSNAKAVLKNSYWESIVAYIVCGAITIGASLVASFVPLGALAGTIFLSLPLSVGLNFFFMQSQVAPSTMQNIFYPFKRERYMKIVGTMAWMYLFIFLWSLISVAGFIILLGKGLSVYFPYLMSDNYNSYYNFLPDMLTAGRDWIVPLIVSGVIYLAGTIIVYIKTLSYSMTAYLMTDNPYIGYDRALKLSIAMTHGHKWNMFVLYLSFIGWGLLAILTFGIGFLFLAPYVASTNAALYAKLRDNAINCGLTSPQELNVYPQ